MSWNFIIRVAYFGFELIIERCLRLSQAIINPFYNLVFRNRDHETEALVNHNNGVGTTSVNPAFANAVRMISREVDDVRDIHNFEICPYDLNNKPDPLPEYVQRSCAVEMAPAEPLEEPPIPVEMAPNGESLATESQEEPPIPAEIPIETSRYPQPVRLSEHTRRMRELCSAQRRLRRSIGFSSPSNSSSSTTQSSAEGVTRPLSKSIPNSDCIDFKNDQINAWINYIIDSTGCHRGVAINALFECNFDFADALAFVESCINQNDQYDKSEEEN